MIPAAPQALLSDGTGNTSEAGLCKPLPRPALARSRPRSGDSAMLPLISPDHPQRVLAWRGTRGVSQAEFIGDVMALAARLPQARQALNLCTDRYHFMTAFAAVCVRDQTNLLPPSDAPGVVAEIARTYPDSYALSDAASCTMALPCVFVGLGETAADTRPQPVPVLRADHVAARVFTSGSTGTPQAHAKTWRTLVQTAQLAARRFLGQEPQAHNIVATVPPQHMFGLETTVMMALAGGCAAHAGRPSFPADVREALAQVPPPRLLITTPPHLRACLSAPGAFPDLRLIISATAPLEAGRAAAAEAQFGAPVHEIYGCTEAGSIATRRTVASPDWRLYPGMRLGRKAGAEGGADADCVHGRHLDEPVLLPDVIQDLGRSRFRLIGRSADMLKVAGKRASLSELTRRLLHIPGVADAVVFVPPPSARGEARPCALVVAPALSERQILSALAPLIDPVFLPRPLIRLPRLPRNAVGKLPYALLLAELERHRG